MIYNGIEMEQIPSFREGMNYEGYYVTKTGDVYTAHYRKGHAIKKMSLTKPIAGIFKLFYMTTKNTAGNMFIVS